MEEPEDDEEDGEGDCEEDSFSPVVAKPRKREDDGVEVTAAALAKSAVEETVRRRNIIHVFVVVWGVFVELALDLSCVDFDFFKGGKRIGKMVFVTTIKSIKTSDQFGAERHCQTFQFAV